MNTQGATAILVVVALILAIAALIVWLVQAL
jgi:hypothetical protein